MVRYRSICRIGRLMPTLARPHQQSGRNGNWLFAWWNSRGLFIMVGFYHAFNVHHDRICLFHAGVHQATMASRTVASGCSNHCASRILHGKENGDHPCASGHFCHGDKHVASLETSLCATGCHPVCRIGRLYFFPFPTKNQKK